MVDIINNIVSAVESDPVAAAAVNLNRSNRSEKEVSAKEVKSAGSKKFAPAASQQTGDVSGVVADINEIVSQVSTTRISFAVDDATGKSIIRVVNRETGDIIRQLPTEELLSLVAKMEQLRGMIFDQEI